MAKKPRVRVRPKAKPVSLSLKKASLTMDDLREDNPKLKRYLEQAEQAQAGFDDRYDQSFWLCVVFQSEKQKQEFLRAIGQADGDYVDGQELAEACGIEITPNERKPINSPLDKGLAAMTLTGYQENGHEELAKKKVSVKRKVSVKKPGRRGE